MSLSTSWRLTCTHSHRSRSRTRETGGFRVEEWPEFSFVEENIDLVDKSIVVRLLVTEGD